MGAKRSRVRGGGTSRSGGPRGHLSSLNRRPPGRVVLVLELVLVLQMLELLVLVPTVVVSMVGTLPARCNILVVPEVKVCIRALVPIACCADPWWWYAFGPFGFFLLLCLCLLFFLWWECSICSLESGVESAPFAPAFKMAYIRSHANPSRLVATSDRVLY